MHIRRAAVAHEVEVRKHEPHELVCGDLKAGVAVVYPEAAEECMIRHHAGLGAGGVYRGSPRALATRLRT